MASQSHESSAADHTVAAEWKPRTAEGLGIGGEKRKAASPLMERRLRERKTVGSYQGRISKSKALVIQQGPGEKLKDIPNVAFKMSKRNADESVRVLHKILFGGPADVRSLKRNILQFSGFVGSQNENKVRLSVKQKLDSCKKDRLLQFCDLLDIYTVKFTTKKEEILDKLLEFLDFPHVTRELVISESKKRLNRSAASKPKRGFCKSLHVEEEDQDGACTTVESEGSVEAGKAEDKEDFSAHRHCKEDVNQNEHDDLESTKKLSNGEQNNEHEQPEAEKNLTAEEMFPPAQPNKDLCPCAGKELGTEDDVTSKREEESNGSSGRIKEKTAFIKGSQEIANKKGFQKNYDSNCTCASYTRSSAEDKREEKGNVEMASMDIKESKKNVAGKSKNVEEKLGMDKAVSVEPSTEQLRGVVIEILKEVDFDVTTLADVIRQLGTHFNSDLTHRKKEIKNLLEEVISEMIDDEEYEENDDDKNMRPEEEDKDEDKEDDDDENMVAVEGNKNAL